MNIRNKWALYLKFIFIVSVLLQLLWKIFVVYKTGGWYCLIYFDRLYTPNGLTEGLYDGV